MASWFRGFAGSRRVEEFAAMIKRRQPIGVLSSLAACLSVTSLVATDWRAF
jgi:hypothetical protein